MGMCVPPHCVYHVTMVRPVQSIPQLLICMFFRVPFLLDPSVFSWPTSNQWFDATSDI